MTVLRETPSIVSEINEQTEESNLSWEDLAIKDDSFQVFKDKKILENFIIGETTLQKLWNLSNNAILAFYQAANHLLEESKFEDTLEVYTFLTLLNHEIVSFWIAKGFVNEKLQNWNDALEDYWMAQALNVESMEAYSGLLRIYKQVGDEEMLKQCLELVKAQGK